MSPCGYRYIYIYCELFATGNPQISALKFSLQFHAVSRKTMDHNSLSRSDEAQPLDARPMRISVQETGLPIHSNGFNGSPVSPLIFSTRQLRDFERQGEAVPACTPINGRQQRHLDLCHNGDGYCSSHDDCTQRLWLWEVLSIVIAALALVAIVITLVLHKERPLPKWPSAITINALIAVFTAIFKACLMMPIAECIGQLKWLWYKKPRPLGYMEQWDLASRGRSFCFISPITRMISFSMRLYLSFKATHVFIFRSMGLSASNIHSENMGPCRDWCYPHNNSNGS